MSDEINLIYYLNLGKEGGEHHLRLSVELALYNLTLVPILKEDLHLLAKQNKKIHLITIISNLKEREKFLKLEKELLYYLKNKKIYFYELSSFLNLKLSFIDYSRDKDYFFFPLPMVLSQFTSFLNQKYFSLKRNEKSWPFKTRPGKLEVI